MREVGVPALDTHFKSLVPALEKAARMRETFLVAQEKFKEILGLSLATSLKKSLGSLAMELGKDQVRRVLDVVAEPSGRLVLNFKPFTLPTNKVKALAKHFNSLTEAGQALISLSPNVREEIAGAALTKNIKWSKPEMVCFVPVFFVFFRSLASFCLGN